VGTSTTVAGIIRVARIETSATLEPRKRYLDSAKAAMEFITSVMMVATTVMKRLLNR
jgi:hypothetical protein